ncbi:MAG TPA: septal ring lytic transglycosylase RlpA family lipoprotein, partial [Alcanivorax sp.]|nr:septal ring lytic transglycosylase RlpA family lipoprotein [Alcanivorax sp.]
MIRALFIVTTALALGACATAPAPTEPPAQTPKPADGAPGSDRYEHKVDSGPEQRPDVESQPEPVPKEEPLSAYGNPKTYSVWGKTYQVMESAAGYEEEGLASWYG